jgi:hypothetical protein
MPKPRRSRPRGFGGMPPKKPVYIGLVILFSFQEKKQKSVVLLRRRTFDAQTSAKPTKGVWGHAPKKTGISIGLVLLFSFQEKKQKSVSSASQKDVGSSVLREAEPRGLGLAPEKPFKEIHCGTLFFSRKEAKALVLLRRRMLAPQLSAKRSHGGLGACSQKNLYMLA